MHPLISTDDLTALLDHDPPPVLLDVRWSLLGPPGREDYDEAHLPGAVFLDLETDLAGCAEGGCRHPLPDPDDMQHVLRWAGVDRYRPVVAYDSGDGSAAARAWWLLRWAGHPQVAVLDGGYATWTGRGMPVTARRPEQQPGDFEVRSGAMPVTDSGGAAELARRGALLDARAQPRYRGEQEPVDARAGHIPGAINAPFAEHTDYGNWRASGELAAHFASLGVTGDSGIGAYCGSGVTACSVVLALEHAGVTDADHPATLYAGSWSDWCSDPDRPAATGAEPG